jgi:CRISPR-associated protein Cmr3
MSATSWLLIEPHDSLFFRDGRPFNQDDEGAAHIASLFPPSPRTVAQMIRAALAAGRGWTGGDWRDRQDLVQELGDGPENIGRLRFTAPVLVKIAGGNAAEPVYPAPLALVARFDENGEIIAVARLSPGRAFSCDFSNGKARLPRLAAEDGAAGWKALDGWYVTHDGLQQFLDGENPDPNTFAKLGRLAPTERRVGIARDAGTRQAVSGALFATDHRRLAGKQERYAICSGFAGAEGWTYARHRPFGGEHRFAWLDETEPPPSLRPCIPAPGDTVCYLIVTTSPMLPSDDGWRTPSGKPARDLPGQLVSACVGKPVMLGGWYSLGANFGPQPLQPHLPAGSVWFMKSSRDEFSGVELPASIGLRAEFGYGGCVYGFWKDEEELRQ